MAQLLDPTVELSLIQQRFPDIEISECGSLESDFFCARKVGSRTFEGRVFLTEKALLFVSTYSDAHDYDLCIKLSDVLVVTTYYKSMLPAIEFTLTDKEELFTNIYNLKTVVSSLSPLLPGKVLENKSASSQRKLNRLLSVPARQRRTPTPPPTYEAVIREEAPVIKAPPCPFFSKCGYCPRIPLCKLQHDPPGSSKSGHAPIMSPRSHGIHDNSSLLLSPSKRIHLLDSPEVTKVTQSDDSTDSKNEVSVDYYKSLSSPARVLTFPKDSDSETQPKRAVTDIAALTDSQKNGDSKEGSQTKNGSGLEPVRNKSSPSLAVASTDETNPVSDSHEPNLSVPHSFNFTGEGQSSKVDDEELVKVKGQQDENVFVFSASNPSSPNNGLTKKRNPDLAFSFTGEGVGGVKSDSVSGVGGEVSDGGKTDIDEHLAMAMLQQLEFGSDSDSLQGDLDLDRQKNLLASYGDPLTQGWRDIYSPPPRPKIPSPLSTGEESGGNKDGDVKEGGPHKRRHCLHFLAGNCPREADCPMYHGVAPDNYDELETMIEQDEFSTIELPPRLKVFPASSLGRGDINSGDKIILSAHVLLACEQQELAYPVAFKLTHPSTGKTVHAGVLEFTSPSMDHGYLPQWMVDHLGVANGEEVEFQHVDLPKGQFVRLQPVSSAWLGIPYDKRMAMMEFQLRNFQTLTEGTKVTLTYELNRYTLKVLECKPAKGISIVDADISTDVVEPADFNRYHSIEEGQAVNTCLDEPSTCTEEGDTYRHFVLLSLPGKPLPPHLRVQVMSLRGDADLFLSQHCTAPSQSRYTWCEQSVGVSQVVLSASGEDGYDVNKSLYAGVVSLCEDTEFTITFHTQDTPSQNTDASGSLSGTTTGRSVTQEATPTDEADSPETTPPGQGRCSYCGSVMPSLRLLMHERHCAQSTFRCPHCKVCVPKTAEKKHHFIAHVPLGCDCGFKDTQEVLHKHQVTDCPKRSVKCQFKWCNLSFPMDQLQNHESLCGRKKVPCPMCQEEVSQLELEIHLEAFHSVDTTVIDWTIPLANQMAMFKPAEPKFKCSCGAGFNFEDDYQVHQLTDCKSQLQDSQPPQTESSVCADSTDDTLVG